jgi:hypothetical protein
LVLRGALVGVLLAFAASTSASSTAPPDSDEPVAPSRLVPIPPGCPVPPSADLAFIGVVVDKDGFIERGTVRFAIEQLRAGSAAAYTVDGIIDVRYGPDSKYLDVGERYLVSAAVDPEIGRLASTVAPGSPLFGGNDVIGLDDTAVECPELEDPIVTLHVDGTSVDSAVLSPMFEDRRVLLATIGVPAAIAGIALIVLVLLRSVWRWMMSGVFALGRAAVTPTSDHRAVRVRRHAAADPTLTPRPPASMEN